MVGNEPADPCPPGKARLSGQPNFLFPNLRAAAYLMALLEPGYCLCRRSTAGPGGQSELGKEGWATESVF